PPPASTVHPVRSLPLKSGFQLPGDCALMTDVAPKGNPRTTIRAAAQIAEPARLKRDVMRECLPVGSIRYKGQGTRDKGKRLRRERGDGVKRRAGRRRRARASGGGAPRALREADKGKAKADPIPDHASRPPDHGLRHHRFLIYNVGTPEWQRPSAP